MLEQGLYKLVGGHEVIEAGQGDDILHPRVVGVEGDDIGNAHTYQLL